MRPYLLDIHFNFKNYQKNIKNNVISCGPNYISNQDEIINYSFILDEKSDINVEKLFEPIILEISAKNPKNLIKENFSFNKNENIIKLPNGNELSKMIVGKALKNNKDLIDDKNKEVNFSLKYQILSGNTALFAEIINDMNDINKNKLITVNLNDYTQEIKFEPVNSQFKSKKYKKSKRAYKATEDFNQFFSFGSQDTFSFSYSESQKETNQMKSESNSSFEDFFKTYSNSPKPQNNKIEGVNSEDITKTDCAQKGSIKTKELKKEDIMKLILSQDIIEGFWDENEELKQLMNNIDKDKVNKINLKIKSFNKGEEIEKKIKYTVLVIYYLNTEYHDKIDAYKIIINKAEKFLMSQGIKYKDIIDSL